MKKFLLPLLLCILLAACAKPGPSPQSPASGEAERIWEKMLAYGQTDSPYRIQFSLRFGEEGDTRRVTGLLWGNDRQKLRMDIMAGLGVVLAKMADDPASFLLYSPREKKAYFQRGATKPYLKVGMPLPFSLPQLAALLNGQYGSVFGGSGVFEGMAGENFRYALALPPGGTLVLAEDGKPLEWKQAADGWLLSMRYENGNSPEQLRLSGPGGKQAIITVKAREAPASPFDSGQMTLEIPAGTPELPLSKYKPS